MLTRVLLLSTADTDLLAASAANRRYGTDYVTGSVPATTPDELPALLDGAGVVVVRLLRGRVAWEDGLDALLAYAAASGLPVVVLGGETSADPQAMAASTVPAGTVAEAQRYLVEGGPANLAQLAAFLSDTVLLTGEGFDPPVRMPDFGPHGDRVRHPDRPTVGVVFYRAHEVAGNTAFVDVLCDAIEARGANALPVFCGSLRALPPAPDGETAGEGAADGTTADERAAGERATDESAADAGSAGGGPDGPCGRGGPGVRGGLLGVLGECDVLVATVLAGGGSVPAAASAGGDEDAWDIGALAELDVPVIQGLCLTTPRATWNASSAALSPMDAAMQVAVPEFDGRLIGVPFSFKQPNADGIPVYVADPERAARLAGIAVRHAKLRGTPPSDRRVAIMLSSYPTKHSRIGNAVGLDTPASAVRLLRAMHEAGYTIAPGGGAADAALPDDGDTLIHALIAAGGHDVEWLTEDQLAGAQARVSSARYEQWFADLPEELREPMRSHWGEPPGQLYVDNDSGDIAIAALRFGNVVLMIQPPRGFGENPVAIYHDPDLPPSHHYLAAYRWLAIPESEGGFGADAVVHLGKHGTLEWLPGKGLGLSAACAPDAVLGDLPLVYPFIVNDPGEGTQAKRRGHATVVDHLIPPMARADTYGELAKLEQLLDEYATVQALDPDKAPTVRGQIWALIQSAQLHHDLGVEAQPGADAFDDFVLHVDGYLCEIKDVQIRDGLHILGRAPEGDELISDVLAVLRARQVFGGATGAVPGLRQAVAAYFGLDEQALLTEPGRAVRVPVALTGLVDGPANTGADAIDLVETVARRLVTALAEAHWHPDAAANVVEEVLGTAGVVHEDGVAAETDEVLGAMGVVRPDAAAIVVEDGLGATGVVRPEAAAGVVGDGLGAMGVVRADGAAGMVGGGGGAEVVRVLRFAGEELVPRLARTTDEIGNVLHALDGGYVPAGPSGSPTRGLVGVLPTGRNFYSVDPKAIPSRNAWDVGAALADSLLQRHLADTGAYPRSVGLTVWGTSAMRTQGDDIAEILALIGCRPVWDDASRRVTGFEVTGLAELGRPRIDVTVRISGFFRDAFPHVITLLDDAVRAVAELDESPDDNYLRAHAEADAARHGDRRRATTRIFGSKPGAYGAGLLPLIDARNWRTDADLAEVYAVWGGYAYGRELDGREARADMTAAYARIQVAAKNQDTREHDIADSDDYFQYHGGMVAMVRSLTGTSPAAYVGDSAVPAAVRTRSLAEETRRVFRARAVNPKWLAAMRRHGYKGAFELAATVDYLFGYDATAGVVEDWMYEELSASYVFDETTREFLTRSNPWALRGIVERLLEAAERGLWEKPRQETLDGLRQTYLDIEGDLEDEG